MIAVGLLAPAAAALATTKGYNQIVTPDIQPLGVLSLSFQAQHRAIGNQTELQYELGITRRFEIAVFQAFSPPDDTVSFEYGLIQKKQFVLSTCMLNFMSGSTRRAPFLEAGYRRDRAAGDAARAQATFMGVADFWRRRFGEQIYPWMRTKI